MLSVLNKKNYKAFGFNIISEIPFKELETVSLDIKELEPSITIELAAAADLCGYFNQDLISSKEVLIVKNDYVMFNLPGKATFLVEGGNKISVFPQEDYDEDIIKLYLLGTCMGIILMQNKTLPLHGSVIEINAKAYAFIGDSGAGKSTLASAFLNRGYKLLSDDIIPIRFSEDDRLFITPSYPQQKLWQDSMGHFGLDPVEFKSIFGRETKFCIPVVTSHFSTKPVELGGIYELVKSEEKTMSITPIENLYKLKTIFDHTYRNILISSLGIMEWHFDTSAKILKQTSLYRIKRPDIGFSANSIVTEILNTIDAHN